MTLVLTEEQRRIRQNKFDRQDLDRLEAMYKKGKEMALVIAEAKFGCTDYIPGYDDGEGKIKSNY